MSKTFRALCEHSLPKGDCMICKLLEENGRLKKALHKARQYIRDLESKADIRDKSRYTIAE